MADEATASRLAWSWVIEALARSHEVDAPVLYDLISKMPELFDNLGKNAREAVALRCLESLFASADGLLRHEDIGFPHSVVHFDSSKSCEEVLFHLAEEESLSNLSKGELDRLKWDVHSFVEHKKGALPKCALDQLKDIILQGCHPIASSLKQLSELVVKDSCFKRFPSEDGEETAPLLRNDQAGVNGEAALARENRNSPILQDGNKVRPEESQKIAVLKKRDRTFMSNGVCGLDSPRDINNGGVLSKKLKQSASCSLLQPESPLNSCDFVSPTIVAYGNSKHADVDVEANGIGLENKSGKVFLSEGNEKLVVSQDHDKLGIGFPCQEFLVPGECNNPLIASEDVAGKNVCANEVKVNSEDHLREGEDRHLKYHLNEGEENSEAHLRARVVDDVPSSKDLEMATAIENQDANDLMDIEPGNIASVGVEQSAAAEDVAADTGATPKRTGDSHHHEEIHVDKEKHDFLSSQQLLNLCVRCYKGGELLNCSYNGCLVVIHESCLHTAATFDSRGRFYCPFCGYSHAISEYTKAKKTVSMARKVLSQFIGGSGGFGPFESGQPRMLLVNDPSCTKSTRHTDKMDKGVESDSTKNPDEGATRQEPLGPCSGGTVPVEDGMLKAREEPSSSILQREEGMVTEKQPSDMSDGPQLATEVNPCTDTAEESRGVESPVLGNATDVGVDIDPEVPSARIPSQSTGVPCANERQLTSEVNPCCDTAVECHGNKSPILENETDVGVGIDPEVLRARIPSHSKGSPCANGRDKSVWSDHYVGESSKANDDPAGTRKVGSGVGAEHEVSRNPIPDQSGDAPSESISDPDGFPGGGKTGSPSRYIFAGRQQKDHRPYEGIPQSRRKKVPWSAEEEDMLKEAMTRFAENENKAIPWKIMLEFGRPMFLKCRTPGDLKDKWKNIQKKLNRGAK